MDVLILDGEQRSALATTRSLGRKNVNVTVGEEFIPSLSSTSKYCKSYFLYPSPYFNPNLFIDKVIKYSTEKKPIILLPMTDVSTHEILFNRKRFDKDVIIPLPSFNQYIQVTNKINLFHMAQLLNVATPLTIFPKEIKEKIDIGFNKNRITYPLVIKPAFSRIKKNNIWIKTSVKYVDDLKQLRNIFLNKNYKQIPFLIQEKINGEGIGIFLLMKNGKPIVKFAHRRIREKPPSGGVSVLCESIQPPPDALSAAIKILEHIKWNGVAMVEFKMDTNDNKPKLIEINARFWGSLQLAIAAGVDFPYMLYLFGLEERFETPKEYRIGLKSRWELGDIDHLVIRLKKDPSQIHLPKYAPSKWKVLTNYLIDYLRPSVKNEIFKYYDYYPFLYELRKYIKNIFKYIIK
jgi:predicted ATP-grasp superfamily ATP-dependent carboligase